MPLAEAGASIVPVLVFGCALPDDIPVVLEPGVRDVESVVLFPVDVVMPVPPCPVPLPPVVPPTAPVPAPPPAPCAKAAP